jgi:hypothetical protein
MEPIIHHQLPERTELQEVICHFPKDFGPEDIIRGRIRTINLMVALCSRQEVPQPKPRSVASHESVGENSSSEETPERIP